MKNLVLVAVETGLKYEPCTQSLTERDTAAGRSCMEWTPTLSVKRIDVSSSVEQKTKHQLSIVNATLYTYTTQHQQVSKQ